MKKFFQLGISLALTVLVGYLIYRGVPDWGLAWRVMIQGRPHFLLAGLGLVLLHMLLRAVRWGVLLSPVKRGISLKNLFSLTLIKYTVNVIPPRAGEVAASLILAGKERISAASVIAASLLERILDMMTVVVIFGFYMAFFSHWYAPNSPRGQEVMLVIRSYSLKGFVVLCLGLAVLAWLLRSNQWQERLPVKLRSILSPFLDGFRGLQQGGVLFQSVMLSVAIWLVITLQLWCFMHAYLDHFPFVGSLVPDGDHRGRRGHPYAWWRWRLPVLHGLGLGQFLCPLSFRPRSAVAGCRHQQWQLYRLNDPSHPERSLLPEPGRAFFRKHFAAGRTKA